MPKLISTVALIVSLIAFLFGGYLNTKWVRTVNESVVVASVSRVNHDLYPREDHVVEIPDDLRQSSEKARYFPTLSSNMTLQELESILELVERPDFQSAAVNSRAVLKELEREGTTDRDAMELWGRMAESDKATLFAIRGVRLARDALRGSEIDMDEERLDELTEYFLNLDENREDTNDSKYSSHPEVKNALKELIADFTRAEFAPTRQFLSSVIADEISELEAAALEFSRLNGEVRQVIQEPKNRSRDIFWEVTAKLYNSGGSPAAMLPIAAMAVKKLGEGNFVVYLSAMESGNIILPPGEGLDVTFRSTLDADRKIVEKLRESFATGERDFRVVFEYLDGKRIASDVDNFSESVGRSHRESLLRYAADEVKVER